MSDPNSRLSERQLRHRESRIWQYESQRQLDLDQTVAKIHEERDRAIAAGWTDLKLVAEHDCFVVTGKSLETELEYCERQLTYQKRVEWEKEMDLQTIARLQKKHGISTP